MEALQKKLSGDIPKVDLDKEFTKAMEDPVFATIVKKTKLKQDELKNYTSLLKDSASEYKNCLSCKNLLDCQNRIRGHVYFPHVENGILTFEYKSCKYQDKMVKTNAYLKNIKYFDVPSSLKEASVDNIHKTDKNRFPAIRWIGEFLKNYPGDKPMKGLYLHGNFGCGKSYFIAALLNELAHRDYKCAIVFWPDFIRQAFLDDFQDKYEYIKKIPLLLIDDIGAENVTAWTRDEVLCPLLQYRMDEGLTTFFTSNLSLEDLENHLASSKTGVEAIKAGRVVSRIKQLTEPIEMVSKNLRK